MHCCTTFMLFYVYMTYHCSDAAAHDLWTYSSIGLHLGFNRRSSARRASKRASAHNFIVMIFGLMDKVRIQKMYANHAPR